MEVDMDNQTLSYKVNGKDYGVAFDEVPKRNVWFACQMRTTSADITVL